MYAFKGVDGGFSCTHTKPKKACMRINFFSPLFSYHAKIALLKCTEHEHNIHKVSIS